MFRKIAAVALVAVTFFALGFALGMQAMPLTVTVGSRPITLVQAATVLQTISVEFPSTSGPIPAGTLAAPSTPGTALVALMSNNSGTTAFVVSAPPGWVKLAAVAQGIFSDYEVWIYLNNPGGISSVSFTAWGGNWHCSLSEWSGVLGASALESSGTATATAGTTLAPTATAVLSAGDVAITGWSQYTGVAQTATFTDPGGWTRLAADEATVSGSHINAEYLINPSVGVVLGPTLTSNRTTTSATGAIVVLKAAAPAVDQTAYLRNDSLTIKLNTFDFGLILGGHLALESDINSGYLLEDGSGYYLLDTYIPQLGDPVTVTNPSWSGRVVSVQRADVVDRLSNYNLVTVAATNTAVAGGGVGPGDFSDVVTGGYYLLEDGSGDLLLEDGSGKYVQEGTSFSYRHLAVKNSQNQDGTTTAYGTLETFEPGFAAGQSFNLTSKNLAYTAQAFTITNVTTTFIGIGVPIYLIEFGDPYQTLSKAAGGVLTNAAPTAQQVAGVAMPAGVLNSATVSTTQGTFTALTDLTGLAVTVTVGAGRRIRITGRAPLSSSVGGDLVALTIQEGATVLDGDQKVVVSAGGFTPMHASTEQLPTAGVHAYKLAAERSSGSGNVTMQAGQTQVGVTYYASIVVEDIGT